MSLPVTGFGKVVIVREERELLGWDKGWKDRWKGSGRGSWGAGGGVEGDKVYVTLVL